MSINATIILSMLETCYSGTTQMFDNTTAPYPISLSLICVPCFLHIKGVIFYYGKTYSRAILNGIEMEENVVLGQHIGTTDVEQCRAWNTGTCICTNARLCALGSFFFPSVEVFDVCFPTYSSKAESRGGIKKWLFLMSELRTSTTILAA